MLGILGILERYCLPGPSKAATWSRMTPTMLYQHCTGSCQYTSQSLKCILREVKIGPWERNLNARKAPGLSTWKSSANSLLLCLVGKSKSKAMPDFLHHPSLGNLTHKTRLIPANPTVKRLRPGAWRYRAPTTQFPSHFYNADFADRRRQAHTLIRACPRQKKTHLDATTRGPRVRG